MEGSITELILKQGLLGAILCVAGYIALMLYRRLDRLHEQRASELKEVATKSQQVIERNSAAMEQHTEMISKLTDVVSRRKGG